MHRIAKVYEIDGKKPYKQWKTFLTESISAFDSYDMDYEDEEYLSDESEFDYSDEEENCQKTAFSADKNLYLLYRHDINEWSESDDDDAFSCLFCRDLPKNTCSEAELAKMADRCRCFPRASDITSCTYKRNAKKLSTAFNRWQLEMKYLRHNCNKDTVKQVVGTTSEIDADLLCADFVATMAAIVCSKKEHMDWELVAVIARTIKKFVENERSPSERNEAVLKIDLLSMTKLLLRRYCADGRAAVDAGRILEDVLELLWLGFYADDDIHPDEQLTSALIKCFYFKPSKVFSTVCIAIGSMRNPYEYYKFWNKFSAGIRLAHRLLTWKSDREFVHQYALVLMNHEKPFETKKEYRGNGEPFSQRCSSVTALIEVLTLSKDINPNRQMLEFLIKHLTSRRMNDVQSMKFIRRNIEYILLNEPIGLHHDADQFASETTKRMIAERLDLQLEQSESMSFLNNVVEIMHRQILETLIYKNCYRHAELDFDFINLFFRLAKYDYINRKESYKKLLTDIVKHCINFKHRYTAFDEEFLQSAIPWTILEIIVSLHKQCSLCEEVIELMQKLFTNMELEAKILKVAEDQKRAKRKKRAKPLADTVPFIIRDRVTLMRFMKAGMFHFRTEELQRGEHVDCLQMLGQVFRYRPDETISWKTVSCTTIQQAHYRTDEDTKVIVLDDGTKIRAKTSPLVKNSEFFSALFDGRFVETSLEEIPLHGVTAFQFHFLVNFIDAPSSTCEINFDMDADEHVDLIILCDKLLLQTLREQIVNSLRWHHLTWEICPEVYSVSLFYGIKSLRKACVNFAMVGNVNNAPKWNLLQRLLQNATDKKLLVEDVEEWMKNVLDSDKAVVTKKETVVIRKKQTFVRRFHFSSYVFVI